jgi:hypothetical protein|tara:strand:+ start:60 stop:386 length:327 start_codon:yes stop_codon:yes gene_type:complete
MTPYIQLFSEPALSLLFDSIFSNQTATINQVLGAGSSDIFLSSLAEASLEIDPLLEGMWEAFFTRSNEAGYDLSLLGEKLTELNVIKVEVSSDENGINITFEDDPIPF